MHERVREVIQNMISQGKVDAVFGEPIESHGKTLVPVAEVRMGLGVGFGSGEKEPAVTSTNSDVEEHGAEQGEGGGGGGGLTARPVAVIEITEDATEVIPIHDHAADLRSKVLMCAIGCATLYLIARTLALAGKAD